MKCEQIQSFISPYLDQMASDQEIEALETHLESCPACRQELEQMQRMCTLLNRMPSPPVPQSLVEDVHRGIRQDTINMFAKNELKRPKRPGWLATSVAGIALVLGIFLSSVVPLGPMIAKFENGNQSEKNKSTVAIAPILDRFLSGNKQEASPEQTQPVIVADTEKKVPSASNITNIETKTGDLATSGISSETDKASNPAPVVHNSEAYMTKINVANLDDSTTVVKQLANVKGIEFQEESSQKSLHVSSAGSSMMITLFVPPAKVDSVLQDLQQLGAGVPAQTTVSYTESYAAVSQELATVNSDLKSLKDNQNTGETELTTLKNRQAELLAQKAELDQTLSVVKVQVYLAETVQP